MENLEIKTKIMEAAEKLFRQYGFNKTTMAEIAGECGMSAANIYRFYENKKSLATELATCCFKDMEESLREVLNIPNISAAGRLEAFILKTLHNNWERHADQPKVSEIIDFISNEQMEVVYRHKGVKQSLIAEILAEGNQAGEFDVPDIIATAKHILHATVFFDYPLFMLKSPLKELEGSAKGVERLIVRGLEKR